MSDHLVKSLAYDGQIRAYAVDATQTVQQAQIFHDTWSAASAALGRTLVATLMLAEASLKGEGKMTVKVDGDGPLGAIVVDGNAHGTVKGYVQHPHIHLPLNEQHKIDVKGAVGTSGFLSVTKDLGLKEAFTGQVPLVSGELGEDFTYYLAKSEQIPSDVGLSVFVNDDNSIQTAGGFLIQVMPGATEEVLAKLEGRLQELPLVSEMMRQGLTPEQILAKFFDEEKLEILEKKAVAYECDCSKERFSQALASLRKEELEEMIREDHGATALCHFCNKEYHFTEDELREIIKSANEK